MTYTRFFKALLITFFLFGCAFGKNNDFPLEVRQEDHCLITNTITGTGETVYVYLPQLLGKHNNYFYYNVETGGFNPPPPDIPPFSALEKSVLNAWEPLTVDSTDQDIDSFDLGSTFLPADINLLLRLSAIQRADGDTNYQVYYGTGEVFNPAFNPNIDQLFVTDFYWGLYTLREGAVEPPTNLHLFVCAPSPPVFTYSFPIPKNTGSPGPGGSIASGP